MDKGWMWLGAHAREGREISVEVGSYVREREADGGEFKRIRGNAGQTGRFG